MRGAGLATEPRTFTPGRRPVMEIAGVPHELVRWTARRSDQIATCLSELEHEYVSAVDDDHELRFLPLVPERARAKLNQIAARKTRPPKKDKARSLGSWTAAGWSATTRPETSTPRCGPATTPTRPPTCTARADGRAAGSLSARSPRWGRSTPS